ncbi:MAG: TatD family hydrolase [bacterium]|nr:TatD family hydrolase [bacterium]
MYIDTHGHVNFNAFKDDGKEVLDRALKLNTWVIMPGSQLTTSARAVELAQEYAEGVYAAVGLHPIHLDKREVDVQEVQSEEVRERPWMLFETRGEEFLYEEYKRLAQSKKVVAIGEVGLDYYHQPSSQGKRKEYRERQKNVLNQQIDLALELDLPLILHCRVAHQDMIALLRERQDKSGGKLRGVMHSYTGTSEQAQELAELGFSFGFNGLIFKDVPALPPPSEVISSIPSDRIVLETDSPYLVPPKAGVERNEPAFVRFVAEEIARAKGISVEEIASVTTANAKALFSLSP